MIKSKKQQPRWRRWCLILALMSFLGSVGLVAGCQNWMARAIVYVPNTDKLVNPDGDLTPEQLARLGIDLQFRVEVGPPTASVSVWIIQPTNSKNPKADSPRATILVLHGLQDKKTSMILMGKLLAAQGYRAILLDSRGHGRSSGQWLTYGAIESRDLAQVLDDLEQRQLLAEPVGAYGASLGGATAILHAREEYGLH